MPALAALVLAGAGIGIWQPVFPSDSALQIWFIPLTGLAGWLSGRRAAAFMLALVFASLDVRLYRADLLHPNLTGTDVLVTGHVAGIPRDFSAGKGQRFEFRADTRAAGLPRRLRLSWYDAAPIRSPGECWQLRVRLKPPRGAVNHGGYDRERDVLTQGIGASGYVRASVLNRRCASAAFPQRVHGLRASFADWLDRRLRGEPAVPLLKAITVGVRESISTRHWELLRTTGTAHLLAISGLHVGMLAGLVWMLTAVLLRGLHRAGFALQWSWLLPAAGAAAAVLYTAAAGFALPTLRALAMLLVAVTLNAARRCWTAGAIVSLVLCGFVLHDATVLLTGSFWLSFCAVILLINCAVNSPGTTSAGVLKRCRTGLLGLLQVQWVLGIGLAPLLILFFGQVALLAPVANLVAVPLFAFGILPVTLAGIAALAVHVESGLFLLQVSCRLLALLLSLLDGLRESLPAVWSPGPLSAGAASAAVLGLGMLLLPRPAPRFRLASLLFLVAAAVQSRSAPPNLRIEVLDVGQGLALLVETSERALLFDTGPAWLGGDAGSRVIVPALRRLGVGQLDALVISHGDADHSGGLASVRAAIPVAEYYDTGNCRRGAGWQWGQTRFRFLHPHRPAGWSENDASCVLLIEHAGVRILLPGDIESGAERVVLARDNIANIDLLVVAHHGSRTSSTAEFVARVSPRFAIFTTGFANRWGFPHPEVVTRFKSAGACMLNTADSGAIIFEVDAAGNLGAPRTARRHWARPWVLRAEALC
jgi:competence protein ComEC